MQVCKFLVEAHTCQLSQMKHRSQGISSPSVVQGMAVEFVSFILPVLGGQAAKTMEETPSRFATTVGHGESQRHIFLISGRKIGSRLFDGESQLFNNINIVHEKRRKYKLSTINF